MKRLRTAYHARLRRHKRVRKKVQGTPERLRLSVYRSLSHIYAQVIDDEKGRTVAAASDIEAEVRGKKSGKQNKTAVAKLVGELVGKRAVEQGVSKVVLDRAGYRYHGRVKALADGARSAGLQF
jgi:large subunit ribosomal protein L18